MAGASAPLFSYAPEEMDELSIAITSYHHKHAGSAAHRGSVSRRADNEVLSVGKQTLVAGPLTTERRRHLLTDADGIEGAVGSASTTPNLLAEAPFTRAGHLFSLNFDDALALIEDDLLHAVWAADGYPLHSACVPNATLMEQCIATVDPDSTKDTWDEMMCKRIGDTWRTRKRDLVWLDDKVAQVDTAASLCDGRAVHLPIYAWALAGDEEAERRVVEAAVHCIERAEPFVVKPRHGANSQHVFMWTDPSEADEIAVAACVKDAITSTDPSWNRECWQLSQVPRGVVLQPMYAIAVPKREESGPKNRAAPLELKVQVLFGLVVGGTLNTHPQSLWVTSEGAIQVWKSADLRARGHVRCHTLDRIYGQVLPIGALEILQRVLRTDWPHIRETSERISCGAGLDELRVDWLLGDSHWGARIGELSYMGAGSRVTPAISRRLTRAFAAAHLSRIGLLELVEPPIRRGSLSEDEWEGLPPNDVLSLPSLWAGRERSPPTTAKTARTRRRNRGSRRICARE
eukprot:TRINITY_DN74299_c0_g1_i1.p1 TRINITY_DN74299_c0_g1~~TRINITY_DN74299_c0_g1_i1.p1  ORF type:complete len:543 (+),score=48.94 TRINITY_DN74299_c0_g1_i1:81-1631(+)